MAAAGQQRYTFQKKVGAGSMGEVWLATDTLLNRPVAIKCLRATPRALYQQQFLREARMLASLNHPNITTIYDVVFDKRKNSWYLVMEYVAGKPLSEIIAERSEPLPLEIIREIAMGVLRALSYAHGRGIVHRDIKPANVIIEDEVKLTDFGLANLVSLLKEGTNFMVGTPAYMAPEQIEGRATDGRADLYSLGVMLYQMITGRFPFAGDNEMEMMTAHLQVPPMPVRQFSPAIPLEFEQTIMRLLARDPEERYPSAEALMDVIGSIPSREPSPFVVGPPITIPRQFFGRERELKRIFSLWQRFPLQHVAVIGPKRSGKTSLLHYLKTITKAAPADLRPGQRTDWLPQPESYHWVLVDFQDARMCKRERLLRYLLTSLDMPVPNPCDLENFMDVTGDHLQSPTVILMDEVEIGITSPELDQPFWWSLRSLVSHYTDGNLAFVLASHDSPAQLAEDQGKSSPFFNLFQTLELGPFTEKEARELIASSPQPFAPVDVTWILEQSGQWPFLLQILCQSRLTALEEGQSGEAWQEDGLRQIEPFRYLLAS